MNEFWAIAAMDEARVIGHEGKVPWRLPEDVRRMKALTMGHTVVMGRGTYDTLPPHAKPLPGRNNIVLSRSCQSLGQGVELFTDAEQLFTELASRPVFGNRIWILGGQQLFELAIPYCAGVELTLVTGTHPGANFMPPFEAAFELEWEQQHSEFVYRRFRRRSED